MRARRLLVSILPFSLLACEPSPDMPAVVVTPNYVENITYNTTVNVPADVVATPLPPAAPAPEAGPSESPAPPPPPRPSRPPSPAPHSLSVSPSPRPGLLTGVPACDEYIARVERCTARMFGPGASDDVTRNVNDSMELMRRSFRRTLRTHPEQRATFVDTCSTSLTMYSRSVQQSARNCE